MRTILSILGIAFFFLTVFPAHSNDLPVEADIVVAPDGSGDFTTLQAAINAAPSNSDRRTVIYIKRGLYDTEKLIVPGDKVNITLIGESREETILSYHLYDCSQGKCPPEDAALWTGDNIRTSATLTILGDGFRAENLTIRNTAGPVGQAQAVTIRSDRCVFINVDFYSYQDTMYFWSNGNRSYFEGCLIVGRTDYIYGGGMVFFQECEIRSWGGGWITAPATKKEQPYGFVFHACALTYALNSPRGGDDGELVRFGRPWNDYPRVAWLYCDMTEMIHPQGWGDTWNMSYAATSPDLHLVEYGNTGPGADMSGRANWTGLRALTEEEAAEYTVQKVLAGNDGWDPTSEAPMVQHYTWCGGGADNGWLVAENWDPVGIPQKGESAWAEGEITLRSTGETFQADLFLKGHAKLEVNDHSTATYLSVARAEISTDAASSLAGKIGTKDTITFSGSGTLELQAELYGVHPLRKTGPGTLSLTRANPDFSGDVQIVSGTLEALSASSLGKSSVQLSEEAILVVGDDNAFHAKSSLSVVSGAALVLSGNVTLAEFYIDGVLQGVGEFTEATHPNLINGEGKVIIGRPDTLLFHRSSGGNWDEPANYIPALMPQAGETVICEEEMETTSTVFEADILLRGAGSLRLRGDPSKNHTSTGTIYMEEGTSIRYNTGGSGMYLKAPVTVLGDVTMIMESGNGGGSTMTLAGPVSGSASITVLNNGKGVPNQGTLLLTGDNQGFSGVWDLTRYSEKYPSVKGYRSCIDGNSENAFGRGSIQAGLENRVIFSDAAAGGDSLEVTLSESAKILLNTGVVIDKFKLNDSWFKKGTYSASTHPEFFEGAGTLYVATEPEASGPEILPAFPGAEGHGKWVTGGRGGKVIYVTTLEDHTNPGSLRYAINQSGARIILFKVSGTIQLKSKLKISRGDVTLAGQTAPGDGITLRDYPVEVDADNVIIRFLRFRMGDVAKQEADALGGRYHEKILIDHCSMSWSTDECVSFYHNENFTLQWSIISESLRNSVHGKGAHGYGGIWGGEKASFHHNLLAHHDSRNPRLGETKGSAFALTDLVDLRNNVIYNWRGNSCYGGEAMNANIVNCYYKPGPATTKEERIIAIDKLTESGYPISNTWGTFYIDGNVMTGSERATNDNWTYGVYNQYHDKYTVSAAEKEAMRLSEPLNTGDITTHSAEEAYERILDFCGASLVRDAVDARILHDVETGTATFMEGGNGSTKGIVDTQEAVGGWPELHSEEPPADTDNDGMPDVWENANGLDPENETDAQLKTVDGHYPNIEVYLNSLVSEIVDQQNEGGVTGVKDNIQPGSHDLKVYFNKNDLMISHPGIMRQIAVYDVTGQMVIRKVVKNNHARINASDLLKGVYIVRIQNADQKIYAQKVVRY
jgi:autotransporter-associated beta strand protein